MRNPMNHLDDRCSTHPGHAHLRAPWRAGIAAIALLLGCGPDDRGSALLPGGVAADAHSGGEDVASAADDASSPDDLAAGPETEGGPSDVFADAAEAPADVAPNDVPLAVDVPPEDVPPLPPEDVATLDVAEPDVGEPPVPDVQAPPEEPDPTAAINAGWIGGACDAVGDCAYADATCLEAWPDGMCTQGCDLYCPDQAGAVTTFCIDAGSLAVPGPGGMCTVRCDFGLSPTGCRPGYTCKLMPRHGQPSTEVLSCVPEDGSGSGLSDCLDELIARGVPFQVAANPNDHPEGHPELTCVIEEPVRIGPVIHGISLRYSKPENAASKVFVSCAAALAIEETLALLAEEGATDLIHLGTYNCRVIAGTTKLSQHGLANAIDIGGVRFDDGAYWTVVGHWEHDMPNPVTEAGKFLLWMAKAMYEQYIWNIILTPEYNAAHDNHFHVDLTPGSHFLSE